MGGDGSNEGRWKHTMASLAVRVLGWALLAWVAANLPTQVRGLCSAHSSQGFTDGLLASTCPGARVRGLVSGRLGLSDAQDLSWGPHTVAGWASDPGATERGFMQGSATAPVLGFRLEVIWAVC